MPDACQTRLGSVTAQETSHNLARSPLPYDRVAIPPRTLVLNWAKKLMVMTATCSTVAPLAAVLALSFAVACGARTELAVGGSDGSGGAGEAPPPPPPPCSLQVVPGVITLPGGESLDMMTPSLQHEGELVSLAQLVSDAELDTYAISYQTFEPWGEDWPPPLPFTPPPSGAPASTRFVRDRMFALIADNTETPFFTGIQPPDLSLQLAVGAARPAFIEEIGGAWFGGFTIAADSQLYLASISAVDELQFDFKLDWGCGSTPVRAAAMPWQGDILVALTSGADFGGCGTPGGAAPATRLQIARFNTSLEGELLFELDLGRSVQTLTLTPRDGGAWLAVREIEGETHTTIDVYRLGEDGVPLEAPTSIDPHGAATTDSDFAASAMGQRLAVSYHEQLNSDIEVQLIDPDGKLGAIATQQANDDVTTTVLGKGKSVLLGFTAVGPVGQTRVMRFDCFEP
jgi:hypothetical protein